MSSPTHTARTLPPPAGHEAPLRVATMVSGLPSTGAENVVVRGLGELRAAGADPVLVTLNTRRDGDLPAQVHAAGIRRIDADARRMVDPQAIRRLVATVRRERFDVLHAHDQDSIILGAVLRRVTGTPLVISRHVLAEPATTVREHLRAHLVLRAARRSADHVIAVADAVGATLATQARVPAERITTVHNGIDPRGYGPGTDRDALRRDLGWDPDAPVVLMVAWFRPGKGHDLLPRIVPAVRDRIPGVRFALAGTGPLLDEVRRRMAPLGDTVSFLGHRNDVPGLLRAADVVLLPSWSEALPTVLLEAGAAARPVVASAVGGSAAIVAEAVTGHLVLPGRPAAFADRLVGLLDDPARARAMGARARERVAARFSVRAQARATVAVYRRVVAARAGAR